MSKDDIYKLVVNFLYSSNNHEISLINDYQISSINDYRKDCMKHVGCYFIIDKATANFRSQIEPICISYIDHQDRLNLVLDENNTFMKSSAFKFKDCNVSVIYHLSSGDILYFTVLDDKLIFKATGFDMKSDFIRAILQSTVTYDIRPNLDTICSLFDLAKDLPAQLSVLLETLQHRYNKLVISTI